MRAAAPPGPPRPCRPALAALVLNTDQPHLLAAGYRAMATAFWPLPLASLHRVRALRAQGQAYITSVLNWLALAFSVYLVRRLHLACTHRSQRGASTSGAHAPGPVRLPPRMAHCPCWRPSPCVHPATHAPADRVAQGVPAARSLSHTWPTHPPARPMADLAPSQALVKSFELQPYAVAPGPGFIPLTAMTLVAGSAIIQVRSAALPAVRTTSRWLDEQGTPCQWCCCVLRAVAAAAVFCVRAALRVRRHGQRHRQRLLARHLLRHRHGCARAAAPATRRRLSRTPAAPLLALRRPRRLLAGSSRAAAPPSASPARAGTRSPPALAC